jgi:hypothetical protein
MRGRSSRRETRASITRHRFERPDSDGVWQDDPTLIDELSEPGVHEITRDCAMKFIADAIAAAARS